MTVPPQGWLPPGGAPPPPPNPTPPPYGQPPPMPGPWVPPQAQPFNPPATAGYGPPGWFPGPLVAKRIPENLPLVVYPSLVKRSLQLGGLALFFLLIGACLIGVSFASRTSDHTVQVATTACPVLLGATGLVVQLYLLVSGGPILAADYAGLWIKTRPTRGQAVWLPWDGIERVYRRRWALDKNVCVKARNPRATANLGAFTAFDASMQRLVFGSDFSATLAFANRSEQEIMMAITQLSAGRCAIQ